MGRIEDKKALRKQILLGRKLLSEQEYNSRSERVANRALTFLGSNLKTGLHSFLPIARNREPDTNLILENIDIPILVSRTDFEAHKMHHYLYNEELVLEENEFRIPEPINGQEVDPKDVDVILVPLLGVDRKGNRIGYGKGYYDQLLTELPENVKKVGLSLSPPLDLILFAEPHDIALDVLITPFESLEF